MSIATTVAVLGFAVWALVSVQGAAATVRADLLRAAWLLPWLMALHLGQLLLSATAWRGLLPYRPLPASLLPAGPSAHPSARSSAGPDARPSLALFWRLRIVREGIDSLLPVAQVGGEIVAARLLTRLGVTAPLAGASIIVDVTLELLTQVAFLAAGLLALATLPGGSLVQHGGQAGEAGWAATAWLLPAVGGMAALLVLAQRFGALRGLELVARAVSRHVPGLADLAGLQAEARAIYRRGPALRRGAALHGLAWLLGTAETWAVLHAIGLGASPAQALVVESLGMAARSAGFALPGAIGVQEGGFILAAAAAGLPELAACLPHAAACVHAGLPPAGLAHAGLPGPGTLAQLGAMRLWAAAAGPASAGIAIGLSLSLLKRLREIGTGTIGLALWRWRWPSPRLEQGAPDPR